MLEGGAERSVGPDDALSLGGRGWLFSDEEEKQHGQGRRCQGHQKQDLEGRSGLAQTVQDEVGANRSEDRT